jgi:hypothetical protein
LSDFGIGTGDTQGWAHQNAQYLNVVGIDEVGLNRYPDETPKPIA